MQKCCESAARDFQNASFPKPRSMGNSAQRCSPYYSLIPHQVSYVRFRSGMDTRTTAQDENFCSPLLCIMLQALGTIQLVKELLILPISFFDVSYQCVELVWRDIRLYISVNGSRTSKTTMRQQLNSKMYGRSVPIEAFGSSPQVPS